MQPSDRCGTPPSAEGFGGAFSYSSERVNGKHTRRVLLVADVSVHRDSLVEQLDREPGIRMVGAASDPVQCVAEFWNLSPDIVLLDVAAEERVLAIAALVASIPDVRVVALGVPETESDIIACAEAGVAACVTREASFHELVANGKTYRISTRRIGVQGQPSHGKDAKIIGGGAGAGAVVGALVDGKGGAAKGALIGAGAGTGGERGHVHARLLTPRPFLPIQQP